VEGTVAWIHLAPVKGLGLVEPDAVVLTPEAVAGDRSFHLADDRGRLVNGKHLGTLVQVRPDYDETAQTLRLDFPDGAVASGPVELGDAITTIFYGRPRQGRRVLGDFAGALTEFAGRELQLVKPDQPGRAQDRGRGGVVSLLSTAACGDRDPRRFRMTFGVDGIPAHAEDDWVGYRVKVGEAVVRPAGHTGRCLVTSQSPDTGAADMDMLQVIRDTRPGDTSEPLPFGVHGTIAQAGTVRLGDPVVALV